MKSGGVSLPKVLIIGYGSPLRGDDNIGCHVAQMLEHHYHDDSDVRVIGSHQLTPEMAEDVAASEFVLFLDAAAGTPPKPTSGERNIPGSIALEECRFASKLPTPRR